MKAIIKKLNVLFVFILSIFSSFSVSIVSQQELQQQAAETTTNGTLKSIMILIFGGGSILLFIVFVLFIIAMIILKIQKKISDFYRKKKDYLYFSFEENSTLAHTNRDYKMKFRNWRRLWITFKRSPIYINTKNEGLRQIGEYNGETNKKENYFMISVYNKLSMFKVIETIILIPLEVKDKIIKRIDIHGQKALIIECEGLDEVGSTDYYMIPLILNEKNEFVDFSDKVRTEFTEKIVYRDVLKENLQEHREAIIKAVESNPFIHQGRRKE